MRRILLVVLTVAVTVGLAGAPASAQTKVRKDKIGDAPANVDIRSVKVQNNATNYALTVRFTRVQRRHTVAAAFIYPGTVGSIGEDDEFFVLGSVPVSGGRYQNVLYRYSFTEDAVDKPVRCPGLTSRWKRGARGYARIVVPQSCLGADAGTSVTEVFSLDKQKSGARSVMRAARRGDETGGEIINDEIASPITTRRG